MDSGNPAARYMITLLTYRNGITPLNPMTRLLDRTTGPWWHDLYNLIIQVLVHLHLLRFNLLLWSACQEGDGQSEHWSIDGNDQGSIVGVLYNKLNSSWPWVIKVQSDIILFHCLVTRHMIYKYFGAIVARSIVEIPAWYNQYNKFRALIVL